MVLGFRWPGIARTRVQCESVLGFKWVGLKQRRYHDTVLTSGQVSWQVSTYRTYERKVSATIRLLRVLLLTVDCRCFNVEVAGSSDSWWYHHGDVMTSKLQPPPTPHHHTPHTHTPHHATHHTKPHPARDTIGGWSLTVGRGSLHVEVWVECDR